MIGSDFWGGIDSLLHNRDKKDTVWGAGDPLGRLLLLPHPVVNDNVKLQPFDSGRVTRAQTLQQ